MSYVQALLEFNPDRESWTIWREKLEIHFMEIKCVEDNSKKTSLLKSVGAAAYSVLHSICSPVSPINKSYIELCEILDTHYMPPTIVFQERKKFQSAVQQEGETCAEWFSRVKTLGLNCKFGEHLQAFTLNQFVLGSRQPIFERLCDETETMSCEQALRKAMVVESRVATKSCHLNESSVNYVKNNNKPNKKSNRNMNDRSGRSLCSHCGWKNHE